MASMSTRSRVSLLLMIVACNPGSGDGTGGGGSGGSGGSSEAGGSSGGPSPTSPTTGGPSETASSGGSVSGDASTGTGTGGPNPTTATTGDDPGAATTTTSDSGDDSTTAAAACPQAPLAAGDHTVELMHDGLKRTALVHVPAGLDPEQPTPVVFNFHGYLNTPELQQSFSGMTPKADAAGYIVVYPSGTETSWNAGDCCGNAAAKKVDDVGFVRALVAELQTRLCIDPKRIFATGMSNGGFMTHRLACEAADLFAAFAPVSAVNGMDECKPSRPVPMLMFNGTADVLVIYTGGGNGGVFGSAPQTFADWAERDGCIGAAIPNNMSGKSSCKTQDICDADVSVTLCTLDNMGHCWPGQPTCIYGTPNTDLSANDMMWEFFQQNPLP